MNGHILERRQMRRQQSIAEHGIVSACVRPGISASVVDVSAAGALIETSQRLLPGTSVEICFDRDKRLPPVRGLVLRCAVAHLGADQVSYRGAVLFDRCITWLAEPRHDGYSVPGAESPLLCAGRASATHLAL
jgi:hypothetical protein